MTPSWALTITLFLARPQREPPIAHGEQATATKAFDVASAKVSTGTGSAGYPRTVTIPDPNRVSARNACLRLLIEFAYNVRDFQVSGPDWLDSIRYDIEAKVDTSADLRVMLQKLLIGLLCRDF